MHSHRVGSVQRRTMIFCWRTASIYIWINMRKNQINKRTAGKNNPVKDQTAGSLSPPPAVSLASIFLQFIPIFLSLSVLPPFSLNPHFLRMSFKQLHFQYSFLALLILFFSLFSSSSPIFHLIFHFMAISLILLIPLFSCPTLSVAAFPRSFSPSLLSSAERNGD